MRSVALIAVAIAGAISFGSTAHATGLTPIPLPEPGTLSILGAAVAGLIIGGRFIRRK
jgi:hypothetical protein